MRQTGVLAFSGATRRLSAFLVLLVLVIGGLAVRVARATTEVIPDAGFESGLFTGWDKGLQASHLGDNLTSSGSGVSIRAGDLSFSAPARGSLGSPTLDDGSPNPYYQPAVTEATWTFSPQGSYSVVLQPREVVTFDEATQAVGLPDADNSGIKVILDAQATASGYGYGLPTDAAWISREVTLSAGVTYTMAWNYIGTDYVPYNDGSITTLVYSGSDGAIPSITVNNQSARYALLGFTNPGTGDYSAGTYGSTGWQISTYEVDHTGLYELGFIVFNLDDTALSPALLVDDEPGTTLRNGEPFGAVASNNPNAPTVPPAPPANAEAPAKPDVVGGDASVQVEWEEPDSVEAIVRYRVRWSDDGGTTWLDDEETAGVPTPLALPVSGLQNGTTYVFQVLAITEPEGTLTDGDWSPSSDPVTPGVPFNLVIPSISGDPWVGETLSVTDPDVNWVLPVLPVTTSYQWESDGTPIPGATADELLVTDELAGTDITVVATRTSEHGSGSAESLPAGAPDIYLTDLVVAEAPDGITFDPMTFAYAVSVSSSTASVDVTPTASAGTSTIEIDGTVVASGSALTVPVESGDTVLSIVALSADRSVEIEYTLTVTRASRRIPRPPSTTQAPPSTAPPSTVSPPSSLVPDSSTVPVSTVPVSSVVPVTTLPPVPPGVEPVRLESGELPELPTGTGLARENGVVVPVVVAQVATSAWEMTGGDFAWRMEVPGVGVGRSAVSPRVGAPRITLVRNTEVVVSGFGFKAGTDVEIWLFSDPVYLGSILVGPDGTFRGGVPVPAAMVVGEHTFQANGESFDGQRRSLSLGVQVVDPVVVELPVTGSDRMPVVWALLILLSGAFLWSRSRGGRLDEFDC